VITAGTPGTESSLGRNWRFLRVPLPHGGERDGVWKVEVLRPGGGEFPPPAPALRCFVNVIPSGGPRLLREPEGDYIYTGDTISPLLRVRQADGSWPHDVTWELTVLRPDAGAGNLLSDAGLRASVVVNGDEIPARQATLQAIEKSTGQPAIRYVEQRFTLKEDAANTRGSFEAAGSAGLALADFLRVEGQYTFHAKAIYGECRGTRELAWTVHVDVGIDPGRTDVQTDPLGTRDGLECQRLTFTPRDRYGNRLGPGRASSMKIGARPGTTLASPVRDLGNGAYQMDVCCDPASASPPGIVIGQPGRPPVSIGPVERRLFLYSVTFLCGEQKGHCSGCAPVRPGHYATEVNIHNFGDRDAPIVKRVIPLVLSGAVRAREPKVATRMAVDRLILPAHTATMDDCCRLQELLLGAVVEGDVPLTTGVLEIVSPVELAVTVVYTTGDGGIDVQRIEARIV
jgi:hypothetical protein